MGEIAGVESLKKSAGIVTSDIPGVPDVDVNLVDEVYSRQDVLEIIKRYEWFRSCFDIAKEDGKSEEDAVGYAKYILKNKYDGYYWDGIDEFMKLELNND